MIFQRLLNLPFIRDERGNVAMIFSFAAIPIFLSIGAGMDYARALSVGEATQSALDSAALGSMNQPIGMRANAAAAIFTANMTGKGAAIASQSFTESAAGDVSSVATVNVPTTLLSAIVPSMAVTRAATATQAPAAPGGAAPAVSDTACILTLGEQLTVSSDVMTFNGSPAVNLSGCSLRSNKSMDCNGHSTGADTYAVGSIVGCSNPHSGQAAIPDIYASLASNISTVCGTGSGGYVWNASGALPAAIPNTIIPVSQSGYSEIHICGNLTLNGASGSTLTGAAPASDTVVVVENGGIIIANSANVVANQTTFVLAGGSSNAIVSWPTGNGGNAASLTVSASTGASNPWQGMAIYENPSLNLNMTWRSGTTFAIDGVLYFPNAFFTISGQVTSGPAGCSKIVVGEFTLNGSVNLQQSSAACGAMGVAQFSQAGTLAGIPYLSR